MSPKNQPAEDSIEVFYRASLIGLRFLDDQQDRASRFGPDADARWRSFQGHLHVGELAALAEHLGATKQTVSKLAATLVDTGDLTQTSARPKRFGLRPPPHQQGDGRSTV